MPQNNIFDWRDGRGWLILSGSGASGNDVETMAINKCPPGLPLVYVFAAGTIEPADHHLAALEDGGAPTGYLLDVVAEDDRAIRENLREVGIVLLGDGPNVSALRGGMVGAGIESLEAAHSDGAVVFGEGAGALIFGDHYLNERDELKPGFGWLRGAIILRDSVPNERVAQLLIAHPDCYALRLGLDSALAFDGLGRVETWGARRIGVSLGQDYIAGMAARLAASADSVDSPDADDSDQVHTKDVDE